jgi:hypothetical protein
MSDARSAAALKHMVQKRMDALDSVQEDGDQLFANEVESHAPDEDGRNWDMHGYRGARGYATEVRMLVDRLRREYRLDRFAPESRHDAEQWSSHG